MNETAMRWRSEPFRLFFPLGVVLGWIGIGHWLLYALGVTQTYSCQLHGLVQMQAFMMAFAVGFLLTALPRRTQSAPATATELAVAALLLVGAAAGAITDRWMLAELAYVGLLVLLVRFAAVRFLGQTAGRRPPAAFVLIPFAVMHGLAGATLMLSLGVPGAPAWMIGLARLLIEQGVFLCLVVGVGSLVLPLMAGESPPPDLGTSTAETRKLVAYAAAGTAILASLVAEEIGWTRAAPIARGAVVAVALGLGGGAWRSPRKPGFHRRLVWLAVWMIPTGLILSGLLPAYRVPALHVLFIGGFALMAFGVATHVALSHLGLDDLARGRPPAVIALAVGMLLALAARLAADASETYFGHLGWAAACWIAGSAVWLGFLGPKLLRR